MTILKRQENKPLKRLENILLQHRGKDDKSYDYVVIGDGPAAILAVVRLLKEGIDKDKILWIGPKFKVGALGEKWPNVPGNTGVRRYMEVFDPIFDILKKQFQLTRDDGLFLKLDALKPEYPCSLSAVAEHLQLITNLLCNHIVDSIEATVTDINTAPSGLSSIVTNRQGKQTSYTAKRIIIATGAEPAQLPLEERSKVLPLEKVSSEVDFENFIKENGKPKHIALVGSSHSAALAAMIILKFNEKLAPKDRILLTHFKNKDYTFATERDKQGIIHTNYNHPGLKGKVALFTKQLLENPERYPEYKQVMGSLDDVSKYSHVVSAIGLKPADTFKINGKPSADQLSSYDKRTTKTPFPGIFVVGAGYPIGNNIGIPQFWSDFQSAVNTWTASSMPQPMFFSQKETSRKLESKSGPKSESQLVISAKL